MGDFSVVSIYKNRAKILVFPMQFEFEDNINPCRKLVCIE